MPWGVQTFHLHVTGKDAITRVMQVQVPIAHAGHHLDEFSVRSMHVDRTRVHLEQLRETLYVVSHKRAPHVIRVPVGDQRSDDLHVIGGRQIHQALNIPSRVNDEAFSSRTIPYQVDEISHTRGHPIGHSKVYSTL
jgi:hypothetical protein